MRRDQGNSIHTYQTPPWTDDHPTEEEREAHEAAKDEHYEREADARRCGDD